MNQEYLDTVRLLLAIAPAVFQTPHFALKGGKALNLFLHDMPRLSVDIESKGLTHIECGYREIIRVNPRSYWGVAA